MLSSLQERTGESDRIGAIRGSGQANILTVEYFLFYLQLARESVVSRDILWHAILKRKSPSSSVFPKTLSTRIRQSGVVAVLVIDRSEHAVPLAKTLIENGIDSMELTLRTPAALDALKAILAEVPDMLAGVGTILTINQVQEVAAAGAGFGVSPGMNRKVVLAARAAGLPFAPGIATPSELENAISAGCRMVKFFPAEAIGGIPYLKSIANPYEHLGIEYIPLGGVNTTNLASYLREPLIAALGGSWIAPRKLIQSENWRAIASNATEARYLIDQARREDS